MEPRVFIRTLLRRWYFVVAVVLAAAGATVVVMGHVGPRYEAEGSILVFPPAQKPQPGSTAEGNPYLQLSGVSQARDILIRTLTSKAVGDDFGEQFSGSTFEVTPDFTNSAPIIVLTVEARSEAESVAALDWLMNKVPALLVELQDNLDIPQSELVTSMALTQDERPTPVTKSQVRAGVLTLAAIMALGLLGVALIDGLLASRRSRRDVPSEDTGVDGEIESWNDQSYQDGEGLEDDEPVEDDGAGDEPTDEEEAGDDEDDEDDDEDADDEDDGHPPANVEDLARRRLGNRG